MRERLRSRLTMQSICLVAGLFLVAALLLFLALRGTPVALPALNMAGELMNKPVKGEIRFEVPREEIPKLPEEIEVYRLEPIARTEEEIRALAAKFGITKELECTKTREKTRYYVNGDNWEYLFNYELPTGEWYWVNNEKHDLSAPWSLQPAPEREEAVKFAEERLEDLELLPEEYYLQRTTEQGSGAWGSPELGYHPGVIFIRRIGFAGKLNGYWAAGIGMEISVEVAASGELAGAKSFLRNPVPVGMYPLKTIEEALEDARKGNRTANLHAEVENPEVTKVELLYYADPPDSKIPGYDTLQPVFVFSGPDTCIYVPAVKR